jgi:hypothetical protein
MPMHGYLVCNKQLAMRDYHSRFLIEQKTKMVCFEWWPSQENKKLSIHIMECEEYIAASYIRSWGDAHGPMYDGSAEHSDTFRLLWQWLDY